MSSIRARSPRPLTNVLAVKAARTGHRAATIVATSIAFSRLGRPCSRSTGFETVTSRGPQGFACPRMSQRIQVRSSGGAETRFTETRNLRQVVLKETPRSAPCISSARSTHPKGLSWETSLATGLEWAHIFGRVRRFRGVRRGQIFWTLA